MKLSIIAALADNCVIGRGGALPWHLPDDLRRFKALTMGHPILMGRRTFESIGKPLPGRRNLVLTRGTRVFPDGIEPVASLATAMARCADAAQLCVIGGAEVYAQAIPLATRLELTRVHVDARGDVRFPEYDAAQWREIERIEHPSDARHEWPMTFLTLERI
ncbi:MAG TPA: dihydrofolate reductase [Steroidobacteraceae bacterium]